MRISTNRQFQQGATAIFIIIFAALLMTVLAVGFLRIMIVEQQRASDSDLSQSAYDSALAGVEDAKRALQLCMERGSGSSECQKLAAQKCTTISDIGLVSGSSNGEVVIKQQSTGAGSAMNQAYTCVKVAMKTDDYQAFLRKGKTLLVPLKATSDITQIELSWQLNNPNEMPQVDNLEKAGGSNDSSKLYPNPFSGPNQWSKTPALMRAQIIAPDSSFKIDDLNSSSVSQTIFLYPYILSSSSPDIIAASLKRYDDLVVANKPQAVACSNDQYRLGGFACKATMRLGRSVPAGSQVSYLRLNPMYHDATISVKLKGNGGQEVQFDGVQPTVDSTGRANDLFRRVESRLSFEGDIEYPENAVDITGSLCKDFSITDTTSFGSDCTTQP